VSWDGGDPDDLDNLGHMADMNENEKDWDQFAVCSLGFALFSPFLFSYFVFISIIY
jgi:hypothetical protein